MNQKMFLRILFACAILLARTGRLEALEKTTQELWSEANAAYGADEFIEARTLYEEIADRGFASGPLYYNLGNTCFRLDSWGWARYYFEKAKLFIPHDPDLRANLNYLITRLPFEEKGERSAVQKTLANFSLWLGSEKCFIIAGTFLVLLSIYRILALRIGFFKDTSAWLSVLLGFCIALLLIAGFADYYFKTKWVSGVIVEKCVAKYSPSPQGADAFEAEEGLFCDWVRADRGWVFIRADRERSGWVSADHIRKIN